MARIITKELALKIVAKLRAKNVNSKKKAHDLYTVEHDGRFIAMISIRRGSAKDMGHDYLPKDLHISPNQARRLGQCTWSLEDFIAEMINKRLIEDTEAS